jgi:hypothetical protein
MKSFFCVVAVLFFSSISIWAQNPMAKIVKGKVVSSAMDLEGIYIVNLKAEVSTVTENGGYFEIQAKIGDTLMFSAVQIKGKKVVLKDNDFKDELFFVRLEGIINQLEEVKIIKYNNINAVALGILQKPAKVYTPAERKLRTAEELHWYSPLLIPLGGMSVDGFINSVSGRTAMLKKEVAVERKEIVLKKLEDLFETNFFINKLKIPSQYVKGFKYYVVEDEKFVNAVNSKNKTMATFVLGDLAVEYLKLQVGEK